MTWPDSQFVLFLFIAIFKPPSSGQAPPDSEMPYTPLLLVGQSLPCHPSPAHLVPVPQRSPLQG